MTLDDIRGLRRPITLDDIRGEAVISVYPELAELLKVSKNTAYRLASEGTVPTLRLGRKLVCPVPALLRLLGEENTITPIDDIAGSS